MIDFKDKLGGVGASEIGALFTQGGLKAKTAQSLAYEKAVELIKGERRSITTVAMQHGIFNESEAFDLLVKPNFPDAQYQSDVSFPIKQGAWATPDIIEPKEKWVADIKCPYTIYTFFKNIKRVPTYYLAQSQMQMLATGFDKGYIVFYLTSNVIDEYGNKIEFDIPISERQTWIEITKDEIMHEEINTRLDSFFKIRDTILKHLQGAKEISDLDYLELAKSDHKVTRFKDKSNLLTWEDRIFKNEREGYLVIE